MLQTTDAILQNYYLTMNPLRAVLPKIRSVKKGLPAHLPCSLYVFPIELLLLFVFPEVTTAVVVCVAEIPRQ